MPDPAAFPGPARDPFPAAGHPQSAPAAGPRSVERALELLDLVADAGRPLGAKALARELGCALSTVYHLAGPLLARGHLVRTAEGYAPGPRVPALHRAHLRHHGLGAPTGDLLGRLRRATGAEAYHTAYRDGLITVVDTTAPVTDTAHPFTPGPEARAHATAHGKALLAAHGMARFTERTITGAERFEAEMATVRGQGYAVSVGEADLAHACLAVALPDRGDGIVHALSVSLPTADLARRQGAVRAALARAVPDFPALPES